MAVKSLGPNYMDADYMQRDGTDGSGSGAGPDFDEDRDDESMRGSGSGDGPSKHCSITKFLKKNNIIVQITPLVDSTSCSTFHVSSI